MTYYELVVGLRKLGKNDLADLVLARLVDDAINHVTDDGLERLLAVVGDAA